MMNILLQNKKRKLIEEYGPYMNKRWAVYDRDDTMEIWWSDKTKALEWWTNNCDRPTFREQRDKDRLERAMLYAGMPDTEDDELPFM